MSDFKIDDWVEALDDTVKGRIVGVDGNRISIQTGDGFDMTFHASELVKVQEDIVVSNYDVGRIKSEKEVPKRKKDKGLRPKERNAARMEVDLHIHQLIPSTKGMSNHDILNIQVDTAKRQLEFAMRKRIQKIVFIHGVGEGVLKEELKYLFGRYDNVTYYDADYRKYGLGATEVYISQKN